MKLPKWEELPPANVDKVGCHGVGRRGQWLHSVVEYYEPKSHIEKIVDFEVVYRAHWHLVPLP